MAEVAVSSADYPAVYAWLLDSSPPARAVRATFARLCEACGVDRYPYGMALDALETLDAGVFESARYGRDWDFWIMVYGLAIYANARRWLRDSERLTRARAVALASDWQSAGFEADVDVQLRSRAARVLDAAIGHEEARIGRELIELHRLNLPELLRLGLLWGAPREAPEACCAIAGTRQDHTGTQRASDAREQFPTE